MVEPTDTPAVETEEQNGGRKWYYWPVVGIGVIVGLFLLALILAIAIAIFADADDAANWVGIIRDLFIIVLAMEGMLIGIAFIVLIVQLAALINLLQNEIQPIVDNANETVSTVRGTAQFMSKNVVEPVVKFGALAAGVGAVMREMIGIRQSLRASSKNGKEKEKRENVEAQQEK